MSARAEYDLVVIGGGAGGLAAARAGVRKGVATLMVQDGPVGGDCTFSGCVPSKSLIEAAQRGASFAEAMAHVARSIDTIAATETADVLRGEGIEVLEGRARFRSSRELDVDGRTVRARRIVVATGARPAVPPVAGLADVPYLTNENVFALTARPRSLIVLGGGAIGCELAQAFGNFGTAVTVVEALPRLVAREEPEASAVLGETFRAGGITVVTGRSAARAEAWADGTVRLTLDGGEEHVAERVLVAVGRHAQTDGLDLAAAGIETDGRGFVATDDHLATTAKGVYAVGDVVGKLQFTHAADEMGRLAVANAFGRRKHRFETSWIPAVTFTAPEIGRVGMTEAEAAAVGGRIAYLPMREVDRAIAAGRTAGFVKLVAGPRRLLRNVGGGQVLGATVVADRGGELVHEAVLAMRTRMFTGRLAQSVHAYPTWSVAVQQAAAQFFMEIGGRSARPARPAGEQHDA